MTEQILVIGATGRVGSRLMQLLKHNENYHVSGTSHTAHDAPDMLKLDLHEPLAEIRAVMQPFDQIYFAAGSRGKDLLQTDLMGNVKVIQAAEQNGVKRFIQLSGQQSLDPDAWQKPSFANLKDYNVARYFADQALLDSQLPYTLIQAGALTEAEPTGRVNLIPVSNLGKTLVPDTQTSHDNTLADVARVMAEVAKFPHTNQKIIAMENGSESIETALAQF